jgi:flavin reductase (DIM6/NTAB) family NADH-FMN oxidoreductase RutF
VAAPEAPFDTSRFRHVLGHFATGVAVITAIGPSGPVGMVVSSFTSVSLEPPLVAFLPDKSSTSWPNIRAAGAFCVNILSAGQEALCAQFARKGIDKFAGVTWRAASSGAPILDGGMAWIDCELTQTFESGDHYIAIGRVLQLEAAEYGIPLVFFQGGYGHLQVPRSSASATVISGAPSARSAEVSAGPARSPFDGGWFDELARVTRMDADDLRRYAKSTEGLVDELVGGYVRRFHDECIAISRRSGPAAKAVGDLLHAAFGSMEDNRVAIMILENERQYLATRPEFGYLEPFQRAIDHVWLSTLQRGIDDGDFRAELDVRLAYRFIRDVLFMAARRYNPGRPGPRTDSAQVARAYRPLVLNGLLR